MRRQKQQTRHAHNFPSSNTKTSDLNYVHSKLQTSKTRNNNSLKFTHINNKPVGFYGPIVPPGPNAHSSECPLNVVPNCEFRTCPDSEFPNALHSEFMNTPNVEFLNVRLSSAPIPYPAGSKWGRPLCYDWCSQQARAACGGRIALDGGVASILALWR